MTDRELMQEALYALTYVGDAKEIYSDTIESLRARLAQPEPEPVAWMEFEAFMDEDGLMSERKVLHTWDNGRGEPLYTTPPQRDEAPAKAVEWQGLTDEEKLTIVRETDNPVDALAATEAKLKEKNGD